jgi:hypothetical protein
MIRHVQYRDFSAVASLDVDASTLGWPSREEGTWVLFQLAVGRTEGTKSRVLQREIASFLVRSGGEVVADKEGEGGLLERLNDAVPGPSQVDVEAARRAYRLGKTHADVRLRQLLDAVRAKNNNDSTVAPMPVADLGMAWIRAT